MYLNLIAEMARHKITQKEMAKYLGICRGSLNLKINGKRAFTYEQVINIQQTFFPDLDLDYLFEKKEV